MKLLYCILFTVLSSCGVLQAQLVMHNGDEIDSVLLSPECKPEKSVYGRIFTGLEIPAGFKGGSEAWFKYCNAHFNFDAVESKLPDSVSMFSDSVVLKFIVTMQGNICRINYLRGDQKLLRSALELLRGSPAWIPGQNGSRYVHSYRTLRFDVHIDREMHVRTIEKRIDSYWKFNDRLNR